MKANCTITDVPPQTTSEICSRLWSTQTLEDRTADHFNFYPGAKSPDPALLSTTRRGHAFDHLLDKICGTSGLGILVQHAIRSRQQKAWQVLELRLLDEVREQRAAAAFSSKVQGTHGFGVHSN